MVQQSIVQQQTLDLVELRTLDLIKPTSSGRDPFISAASGCVLNDHTLHVVSDDELFLISFNTKSNEPGILSRLLPGQLPDDPASRKSKKPDFEALIQIPTQYAEPFGALLALPSGSKKNRKIASLISLDKNGMATGKARSIDLKKLYTKIESFVPDLNIEGAVVLENEDQIVLIQRGNGKSNFNATIKFSLTKFVSYLDDQSDLVDFDTGDFDVTQFDLGEAEEVPLTFTDAALLKDGRILFTAVAEDTDDTYEDGRVTGVTLGIIENNKIKRTWQVSKQVKVEGITIAGETDKTADLLLVTDADDPTIPASLYSAKVSF